jgi:tRNA(Ile)-lysidine synthase TilS/MesJ/uncharacterized protein (DUF924 family)
MMMTMDRRSTMATCLAALVGATAAFTAGYVFGGRHRRIENKNDGRDDDHHDEQQQQEEAEEGTNLPRKGKEEKTNGIVVVDYDGLPQPQRPDDETDVEGILSYWFGKYKTISELQSNLWMIPEQRHELRHAVDVEIFQLFSRVVKFYSSSDGTNAITTVSSPRARLARIVVLDQFTRHLHRLAARTVTTPASANDSANDHNEVRKEELSQWLLPQATYDQMAYQIARSLHEDDPVVVVVSTSSGHDDHQDNHNPLYDFTIPMRIFSLLPYRHQNTAEAVTFVQQQITQQLDGILLPQCDALIQRFRAATNRRLDNLLSSLSANNNTAAAKQQTNDDDDDDESSSNNILAHWPFPADRSTAYHHVVYQTIRDFLANQQRRHQDTPTTPWIISLSGGVDSMVIASVVVDLLLLQNSNDPNENHHADDGTTPTMTTPTMTTTTPKQPRLVAVHIDYRNRTESGLEAAYVANYCRDVLHIPCHVRRIDEMARDSTKRDEYERASREIRYDAYRAAAAATMNDNDNNNNPHPPNVDVVVMLGHHKGDLRENVLSNVHKGCTVLELSGMTAVSRQHDVTMWRPLLPLEKDVIFDYAHRFGVPYFKDTTPLWSTRGKLRTKLLPLIQDVYGDGSLRHLSQLAVESDACRDLVFGTILRPFLEQVERRPLGISFATAPWRNHGLFFWKVVLRETLHSAGLGMFTDKMVVSFLERACCSVDGDDGTNAIKTSSIREGWLQCRRDYAVYLQQDGRVFVFYPSSFPWNKHDQYVLPTEFVGIDEETRVGPWTVLSSKVSKMQDDGIQQLLETKAVPSFQHFMNGTVEYYVALHESGGEDDKPLGFGKFSKANRPDAWKATDLRIQDTLPLLVPKTRFAQKDASNGEGPVALVKVSLTLLAPTTH